MTTTSLDWPLAGTLLALMIVIMSAYAALLWYVLGNAR
jgi:hypothetical protein